MTSTQYVSWAPSFTSDAWFSQCDSIASPYQAIALFTPSTSTWTNYWYRTVDGCPSAYYRTDYSMSQSTGSSFSCIISDGYTSLFTYTVTCIIQPTLYTTPIVINLGPSGVTPAAVETTEVETVSITTVETTTTTSTVSTTAGLKARHPSALITAKRMLGHYDADHINTLLRRDVGSVIPKPPLGCNIGILVVTCEDSTCCKFNSYSALSTIAHSIHCRS